MNELKQGFLEFWRVIASLSFWPTATDWHAIGVILGVMSCAVAGTFIVLCFVYVVTLVIDFWEGKCTK